MIHYLFYREAGLLSIMTTSQLRKAEPNNGAVESSDATRGAECALESLGDNILLEAILEFERTAKKPIIQGSRELIFYG